MSDDTKAAPSLTKETWVDLAIRIHQDKLDRIANGTYSDDELRMSDEFNRHRKSVVGYDQERYIYDKSRE